MTLIWGASNPLQWGASNDLSWGAADVIANDNGSSGFGGRAGSPVRLPRYRDPIPTKKPRVPVRQDDEETILALLLS